MRRLAKEYNSGLADAIAKAEAHNAQILDQFRRVGVVRKKDLKTSLVPVPRPCPENLCNRFVRKFLQAFSWKKVAHNTGGQYLEL